MDLNKNVNNPEKNPYEILGINEGADFEDIQKARDLKVEQAGDDLILKEKIESSFNNISIKLSIGLLFLISLLISPDPFNRLLLSISTLILTYIQIKSGKRFISSLGWSVTFLSIGLIFGGLLENNSFIQEISNDSLSIQTIQSIPAIIILWIGVVLL